MRVKHVEKQGKEYVCDIDITVQEWKDLLYDEEIFNKRRLETIKKWYDEMNHRGTCTEIGAKYDMHPQALNATVMHLGKAIQAKLDRFKVIGTDGKETFWIIVMCGRSSGSHFEWELRPELTQAIDELKIF